MPLNRSRALPYQLPCPCLLLGKDKCRVTSPGAIVSFRDIVQQSRICAAPARTSALACRKRPKPRAFLGLRHLQVGSRPRRSHITAPPIPLQEVLESLSVGPSGSYRLGLEMGTVKSKSLPTLRFVLGPAPHHS